VTRKRTNQGIAGNADIARHRRHRKCKADQELSTIHAGLPSPNARTARRGPRGASR
jgi:hypothetical protein